MASGEDAQRGWRLTDQFVVAVQLDLDTDGFTYFKWGAEQQCKRGDWLVDNEGDIYTVDGEVFSKTYRNAGPGTYVPHLMDQLATLTAEELAATARYKETKA